MATTGRLSAAQRTAILSGAPFRQKWTMIVPNAAHTSTTSVVFATADNLGADFDSVRIIKAGSRKHEVWNPSPNVKNTPRAARYSFTVDNSDGYFYETSTLNVFKVGSVQSVPQECYVKHQIYVGIAGLVGDWTWSEITHMAFTGQITDIIYDDGSDQTENPTPINSVITCEQNGAWEVLRRVWRVEDATDFPMTQTNEPVDPWDFVWTVT